MESHYTNVAIDKINDDSVFDMAYGSIKINYMPSSNSTIDIIAEHTSIQINDAGSSYNVDFIGNYTGFTRPQNFTAEVDDTQGNKKIIRGYKGSKTGAKLRVRGNYGSLKLK